MASKSLFQSIAGRLIPRTDARNDERAPAYQFTPKHMLAQYAATGCLNSAFYASAEEQLETALDLCGRIEPLFVAKTAVYSRETGSMKDMPALLCASLAVRDSQLLERVFPRVIDNGRMLRNFVQIIRSGVAGRKSLGTLPKRLVREWLDSRSDEELFHASVGASPSLADIVKMTHPKPKTAQREALYAYLIGRQAADAALPPTARDYEAFKATGNGEVPDVPFQMLTSLELRPEHWIGIARRAPWQMTRMNLNTFGRHGVFEDKETVRVIAQRLRNAELIEKSRALPYQLMTAYAMADSGTPRGILDALQDAMEIATRNTPAIEGEVVVCPDVSGSMTHASITGQRKGATSVVRCIDVAALAAASIVRRNPKATVLPFDTGVVKVSVNPRDSIMTNAEKLSRIGGGGTNCSAPLAWLDAKKAKVDLVVFLSDNESWVDAGGGRGTETMRQWSKIKRRNPQARLACIDIQPYKTTQAKERDDILNVGGFSDRVFDVVSEFAAGRLNPNHWVGVIEAVSI